MQFERVKDTAIECFNDENFIARLQDKLLGPIASRHVAEAVRAKNQEIDHLRFQLTAARAEIDNLEQYSRRNTLTISGLPEKERENTDALVMDLAKAAGVTVAMADLDRTHRIGKPKRDKPRQIVAKFVSFNKRQELLEARRDLRAGRVQRHPILTERVLAQTFISENLTKKNQLILFVARQLRRKGKIHSVWTNNCQIKIRARENGPTIRIHSLNDIGDIVGDDPDIQSALQQTGGGTAAPAPRAGSAPASSVTGAAGERARGEEAAPAPAGSTAPPAPAAGAAPASPEIGDTAGAPVCPLGAEAGAGAALTSPESDVTAPELGAGSVSASPGATGPAPTAETVKSSEAGAAGLPPEAAVASPKAGGSGPPPGAETTPASSGPETAPASPVTGDDLPATPSNTGRGGGGKRGKRGGRQPRNK